MLDLFALNAPQREAVLHDEGPLLVLAGAGSGKTRVIVYRIARLLLAQVAPEAILAVTFTNKAALEMRARLRALAGSRGQKVVLSTFHALGLSILREEHAAAGLAANFSIYDGSDLLSLTRELLRGVQVSDRRLDAQRVLELLLQAKRDGLDEVALRWGDDYELAAYDLYPKFSAQMRAYGAVDFDDLILRSAQLLRAPEVAARWRHRFRYVLVDEYQDTSPDQLELLRALCQSTQNVCAVGDDDQAIYAWRGAAVDNILRFAEHFAGTREVVLAQNYRSTKAILAAANSVIAHNAVRKQKTLWSALPEGDPVQVVSCADEQDEADFVAQSVHTLLAGGTKACDVAILCRSNGQGKVFEETLRAERLEVRVLGGQAVFDRKEARDALAFLTLLHNPNDEVALRRVINVPARGLGPTSVERLASFAAREGCTLAEALRRADEVPDLTRGAREGALALDDVLGQHRAQLRAESGGACAATAESLLLALGLKEAVLAGNDADGVRARRLDNLEAILRSLSRFEERSQVRGGAGAVLAAFLRVATLQKDAEQPDGSAEELTLMTLHAAKGLEFGYVFVVGVEEDLLPHRRALEDLGEGAHNALAEERRLCYVGITRAQRRLWLSFARERRRHGRNVPRTPSRFLDELPAGPGILRVTRDAATAGADDGGQNEALARAFFARMRAQLGYEGS